MASEADWNPSLWLSAGGSVPSDWDLIPFGDLLQSPKSIAVGVMYPGSQIDGGVPLIRVGDVGSGGVVRQPSMAISPDVHYEYRRTALSGNELLITLVGTPGVCVLARPEMAGWNVARALAVAKLKQPDLRPFIKAVLESSVMRNIILGMLNTTVQPTLNLKEIKILPVPMPHDLTVALELGRVAELFNERIASLQQTNTTLEAIAQALFKSWFVDFNPVRAKAEGREPEGMDGETAALFPAEFADAEVGSIPKGWRAGQLSDVLELKYGKSLRAADRKDGEVPVYGSGGVTGFHDKPLIEGPAVIVGRKGTVGSIYWEPLPCFPIDTVFYVEPKQSLHFAYFALRQAGLDGLNTDAAVPGLNRNNAYRQPVVIPPPEVLWAWGNLAAALRARMDTSQAHVVTLRQLRDTLLPRLISGKLRLPDAEREIEAATV